MLSDLADACRASGLTVVELPGWRTRGRPGSFDPRGVLCHHTGGDSDTRAYVEWMALEGRSDLPAPLCQVALSRDGVVYVLAAGRANHGGTAQATGPMPAGDANTMYVGIEAMNNGSEGWTDTQRDAYARLCAALCVHYGWPASHVRAHRETSVTGKWDPGLLDMDRHRAEVARLIDNPQEDTVSWDQELGKWAPGDKDKTDKATAGQQLGQARGFAQGAFQSARRAERAAKRTERAVEALAKALGPEVEAAVREALADAVVDVDVTVGGVEL